MECERRQDVSVLSNATSESSWTRTPNPAQTCASLSRLAQLLGETEASVEAPGDVPLRSPWFGAAHARGLHSAHSSALAKSTCIKLDG